MTPTTSDPAVLPPMRPIGVVRTPQRLHHEAPRQSGLGRGGAGTIELRHGLQNALADLAGFSHLWVLFWCHLARGFRSRVVPPRDSEKRGLFATRAPQRPNPIGLSCVRLVRIEKRVLHIADHDMLDGTPVLDLKPYLRYCDSVPEATLGYVERLSEALADHRCWWHEKGVAPPAVYRAAARDPAAESDGTDAAAEVPDPRGPGVSCDSPR